MTRPGTAVRGVGGWGGLSWAQYRAGDGPQRGCGAEVEMGGGRLVGLRRREPPGGRDVAASSGGDREERVMASPTEAVDRLQQSLEGRVLLPGSADYDEARTLFNAMIDKRPGADRPVPHSR